MDTPFNLRDIGYTIISRFEETFRSFLSDKTEILFSNYQDGIPKGIIEKAKERTSKLKWDESADFFDDIDFVDLKEIVFYKDHYNIYFPNKNISKIEFENIFDELYRLRCKIAHVRGYFISQDLDYLFAFTQKVADNLEEYGIDFISFIKELKEHPENVVVPIPKEFSCEDLLISKIPNNVPVPDYEYEGGFVGREDDIKTLLKLLEGDLHRVITISGAGGVGKTALSLRVIQKLMQESRKKLNGVVWLSAKETKLSYLGIEDIEPTIKNYEQLLDTISEVMGFGINSETIEKKEEDVKIIFELHDCVLIVIDNLETITDERIIKFIFDAHPKIMILITSRKGLGQVERRYELRQLKEKEAVYLFRQVSKDKKIDSLAKLDEDVIKNYVAKVSYYPLAIKWVIGHVAMGKDIHVLIDSINETTSDISHFCFDHIYNGLSDPAKKILCALSFFDDPPSVGVLKYVVNINQNDFEDGIHELLLVSLVIPDQYKTEQNEISRRFTLLSLTRGYVRQQVDHNSILKRNIEERLQTVNSTIEEAERAKKQYRFSLSNLGATTEEEKVAAMIAQTAFTKYQAGMYIDAVDDYKRACDIAPRFASLYRNWAVMESLEGHSIEADDLMERASKLNSKDPQIWLTWGNIKRKGNKIKDALVYYQKAYDLNPNDYVILNALGQAKSRLGDYDEADKLFRSALQKETTGSSIRHEIINRSSIADNLSRRAESLVKDRNYKEAEKILHESLEHCEKVIELDKTDIKSLDLFRHILIQMGYFYRDYQIDFERALNYFKRAIIDKPIKYSEARDTVSASLQVAIIYDRAGDIDKAKDYCMKLNKIIKSTKRLRIDPKLVEKVQDLYNKLYRSQLTVKGKIIQVNIEKGYVIIESYSSPGSTFLGFCNDFISTITILSDELINLSVIFIPQDINYQNSIKKCAKQIRIILNPKSQDNF